MSPFVYGIIAGLGMLVAAETGSFWWGYLAYVVASIIAVVVYLALGVELK